MPHIEIQPMIWLAAIVVCMKEPDGYIVRDDEALYDALADWLAIKSLEGPLINGIWAVTVHLQNSAASPYETIECQIQAIGQRVRTAFDMCLEPIGEDE